MTQERKSIVLLSGGVDSTTLLYYMRDQGFQVHALRVGYGQRHKTQELTAAGRIVELLQVPITSAGIDPILFVGSQSSQVGAQVDVPEGHYADQSMKVTVVPNRNMLLLSMAGALAESVGADVVAYAAHAGDHTIYPDCRPEFVLAASQALQLGTYRQVEIIAPFINMTKADIVRMGHALDVPFHLTYSCYKGQLKHCGKCGTCVERREAFKLAGVKDPTVYDDTAVPQTEEANEEGPKPTTD